MGHHEAVWVWETSLIATGAVPYWHVSEFLPTSTLSWSETNVCCRDECKRFTNIILGRTNLDQGKCRGSPEGVAPASSVVNGTASFAGLLAEGDRELGKPVEHFVIRGMGCGRRPEATAGYCGSVQVPAEITGHRTRGEPQSVQHSAPVHRWTNAFKKMPRR